MVDASRKLATIVALDVAGYSARTEADETKTTAEVAALRGVIEGIAKRFGGRVFNTAGDGFMLEFGSSLAAVEAAFILAETCEPKVRVGVHLGDVLVQPNGDLLGHGVNVAARLMAQSGAGSVLVSGAVRQSIRGPVAERLHSQGSIKLDKMAETIEAFALLDAKIEPVPSAPSSKLSICVLPFANMSDDPQQEYFADGISEDIITDLSKVSALFVVSRNSAFIFKGKYVDVPKVARELKVTHVLEGSVRKVAGRVRITAQLVDGLSNGHVWAERYDRDLNDIFALQDEISEAIVKALKLQLLPEEKKAIEQRGTTSIDAYNLYLMARHIQNAGKIATSRGSEAIIRLCTAAVKIDPNYAHAWATMALASAIRAGVTGKSEEGLAAAERAITLDPSLAEPYGARARILANRGDFEGARAEMLTGLRLDPNSFDVNYLAGIVHVHYGKLKEAIPYFEKAIALIGDENWGVCATLMSVYVSLADREQARRYAELTLAGAQRVLVQEPDNGVTLGCQAQALVVLDQPERARETISRGLLLDPDNEVMKFSFLRTLAALGDAGATLDLMESMMGSMPNASAVRMITNQPDFAFLRDDPRFTALMAAAKARIAPN